MQNSEVCMIMRFLLLYIIHEYIGHCFTKVNYISFFLFLFQTYLFVALDIIMLAWMCQTGN